MSAESVVHDDHQDTKHSHAIQGPQSCVRFVSYGQFFEIIFYGKRRRQRNDGRSLKESRFKKNNWK